MDDESRVKLFMQLLVNRVDMYAVQYAEKAGHGYRAVRKDLTHELVRSHLEGTLTIGVYALSENSTAKWLVIDIDTTNPVTVEAVLERSADLELADPVLEFSGRKGFHLWWFFTEPIPGWQARRLGLELSREHEVFPKQGTVSQDTSKPGSLVKAPLGIHQGSGKWSQLVNTRLEFVSDPWRVLETAERVNMSDFLPRLGGNRPDEATAGSGGRPQVRGRGLRPCIAKILAEGVPEGCRNEAAHLIASEMRRLGRSRDEAAGVLKCWNLRNKPRLPLRELLSVLESAYSRRLYSYGCGPGSHLRRVMNCLGEEECQKLEDGACTRSCACKIK